jgi:hypothetical protein
MTNITQRNKREKQQQQQQQQQQPQQQYEHSDKRFNFFNKKRIHKSE